VSHSDTDGYRILNFRNFRIRIGYGYANIVSDMDQELKNQYPLTSVILSSVEHNWLKLVATRQVGYAYVKRQLVGV